MLIADTNKPFVVANADTLLGVVSADKAKAKKVGNWAFVEMKRVTDDG